MTGRPREETVTSYRNSHDVLSFDIRRRTFVESGQVLFGECSCRWHIMVRHPPLDVPEWQVRFLRVRMVEMWTEHLRAEHPDYTTEG